MEVKLLDTLNKQWKDDKTSYGFKMLQKMGWKENTGLGKDAIGDVQAIKIKKREDGLGLGCESIGNRANNNWGATATSYASVLEALKASYSNTSQNNENEGEQKSKKDRKKDKKQKKEKNAPIIEVGIK